MKSVDDLPLVNQRELSSSQDRAIEIFYALRAESLRLDSLFSRNSGPAIIFKWRTENLEIQQLLQNWLSIERDTRIKVLEKYLHQQDDYHKHLAKNRVSLPQGEWGQAASFFKTSDLNSIQSLITAMRKAAKKLHPDVGGTHEDMVKLNALFDLLLRELERKPTLKKSTQASWRNAVCGQPHESEDKRLLRLFEDANIREQLIALRYFDLLVDDWNLDAAAHFFSKGEPFQDVLSFQNICWLEGYGCFHGIRDRIFDLIKRCSRIDRFDLCEDLVPISVELLDRHTLSCKTFKPGWEPLSEIRRYNGILKTEILRFKNGDRQRGKKFAKSGHLMHPRQNRNVQRLTNGKLGGEAELQIKKPVRRIGKRKAS